MTIETIGVRDLKNKVTRILRAVREDRVEYVVTVHGEPVALIRPCTAEDVARLRNARLEAHLADLGALAGEIGRAWTSAQSSVELLEEQRRG
jgi:prevent-host-death family protein